jgi:hypothetical protein
LNRAYLRLARFRGRVRLHQTSCGSCGGRYRRLKIICIKFMTNSAPSAQYIEAGSMPMKAQFESI